MTHNELVDLSHNFVLKNMSCGFAVKEIKTVEKFIPQRYTIYFTCASDKVKKFTDKPVNYIMQKQLYLR